MKDPKHIAVKVLFDSTAFLLLQQKCHEADVPMSKRLRDLSNEWVNDSSDNRKMKCPCRGHVQDTRPPKMNLRAWSARRNI